MDFRKYDPRRVDYPRVARRILPVLRWGTSVVDKIPKPGDTVFQVATKVLALADAALKSQAGGDSRLREMVAQHNMTERESETFVRVFFATPMRHMFTLRRIPMGENEELVEALTQDGKRLFFREFRYVGRSHVDSTFYLSEGLDLGEVVSALWTHYPHGLYVSVTREPGSHRTETSVCEVPPARETYLSRKARENLELVVARHRQFLAEGVHRCYLCLGPPGTGKSTFAVLFARAFGGRALKIDAACLNLLSIRDFGFLLETLQPSVLIVDDMDRAPVDEIGARVLFLMERLKAKYPRTAIVLTANDSNRLDYALLRSERIDVPVEFPPPEPDEILQMVTTMLEGYGVVGVDAEGIVDAIRADDLTHAYVHDMCRRLRHEPVDEVLANVRLLRQLSKNAQGGQGGPRIGLSDSGGEAASAPSPAVASYARTTPSPTGPVSTPSKE